jgi:hypothetical protein
MPGRQSSKSESKSQQQVPRPYSPFGPIMCSSNIPSYKKPAQPVQSPAQPAQPAQNPAKESSGFLGSVKEGIALGIGSSLGNRIVSGFFGPPSVEIKSAQPASVQPASVQPTGRCDSQQLSFNTCIQERREVSECEEKLAVLNKCLSEK